MNIFQKLLPENLYHSYLVEGDPEEAGQKLLEFLCDKKITQRSDPDLFFERYESLTIQNSREIKDWNSKLPTKENGKKICLIGANFINREAEQSLLKIIEEPGKDTYFFIITPNTSILLDTIHSRTHTLKYTNEQDKELSALAKKIIDSSIKNRLEIIANFVKENKNEDSSGSLRRCSGNLLGEIEKIIYQNFKNNTNDKKNIFVLEEIIKGKKYLNSVGASAKMILEHIALIL
jgi:DNA polymerase III delta prime subunit